MSEKARVGRWLLGAGIVLTVLVGVGLYSWRAGLRPSDLGALGYPGVFLVMLLSGASMFFPAPGQATVLAAGAVWNPLLVGLAAGLGNATGEVAGYAAGRAGVSALGERRLPWWWSGLRRWLGRYGFFAILLMAAVPNPVFDAVGILAGSLGYSVRRFWLACAVGNTVKYAGLAYLGDLASLLFG